MPDHKLEDLVLPLLDWDEFDKEEALRTGRPQSILSYDIGLSEAEKTLRGTSFQNRASFERAIIESFEHRTVREVFWNLFADEATIEEGSTIVEFEGFILQRTSYALQIFLHEYMKKNQPHSFDFIRTDVFQEDLSLYLSYMGTGYQIAMLSKSTKPADIETVKLAREFQYTAAMKMGQPGGDHHYIVKAALSALTPEWSHYIFEDSSVVANAAANGIIHDTTWERMKEDVLSDYGLEAWEWMEDSREEIEKNFKIANMDVEEGTFLGFTNTQNWFNQYYGDTMRYEVQAHRPVIIGTTANPGIDPILDQLIIEYLDLNTLYEGQLSNAVIANIIQVIKRGFAFDQQVSMIERKDDLFEKFRLTMEDKIDAHLRSLHLGSAAGENWLEAIDALGIKLGKAFLRLYPYGKGQAKEVKGFTTYNEFFDQIFTFTPEIIVPPEVREAPLSIRALVMAEVGNSMEGIPILIRDSVIAVVASRLAQAIDGDEIDLDTQFSVDLWWNKPINSIVGQINVTIRTFMLQMDGGDRLLANWDSIGGGEYTHFMIMVRKEGINANISSRLVLEEAIQPFIPEVPEIEEDEEEIDPGRQALIDLFGDRLENFPEDAKSMIGNLVGQMIESSVAWKGMDLEDIVEGTLQDEDAKRLFEQTMDAFVTQVGRSLFPEDEYAQVFINSYGFENFFNDFPKLKFYHLIEIARIIYDNELVRFKFKTGSLMEGVELDSSTFITDEDTLEELADIRGDIVEAEIFKDRTGEVTQKLALLGIDADELILEFLLSNPNLFPDPDDPDAQINLLDAEVLANLQDRIQTLNRRRVHEGLEQIDFDRAVKLLTFFQTDAGINLIDEEFRLYLLDRQQDIEDKNIAQDRRATILLSEAQQFEDLKTEVEFVGSAQGQSLIALERKELVRQRFKNVFRPALARTVGRRFGTRGARDITAEIGEELFEEFNIAKEQLFTEGIPKGQPFSQFTTETFTPEAFVGGLRRERFEGALTSARGKRRIGLATPRSGIGPSDRRSRGGRGVGIG
jgi:hypothetical protein